MSLGDLLKFTNFATSSLFILSLIGNQPAASGSIEEIVKKAALEQGLELPENLNPKVDSELASLGREVFDSEKFSLNSDISCRSCHLNEFGSSDGIPNAVGIGGKGKGPARLLSNGAILPRNTLPLWGRGAKGFDVFFWDGRVDYSGDEKISQFGAEVPSSDPLVTAIHLPIIEIREMLIEDTYIRGQKREDQGAASDVYGNIAKMFVDSEPDLAGRVAGHYGIEVGSLTFLHLAQTIAAFISDEFAIKRTKFHDFVFGNGELTVSEKSGAVLFYGSGKCVLCHSGPYFSDLDFHAVPFLQLGFGKNGFGVDYGRYNVTQDPSDLYRFRTPPLLNASKTAPYGHSGSANNLSTAIVMHFDPLRYVETAELDTLSRSELYKRLLKGERDIFNIGQLADSEVADLVAFLRTLNY